MAFCFKKKETVAKAARRLSCGRIEHALECLKNCEHAEAIHCARKDFKKARAVLRLVRAQIPEKKYRRILRHFRKAAEKLAGPRDACVIYRTLTNLRQHFKGQLAPNALSHLRHELGNASDEAMKCFAEKQTVSAVERHLRRATTELKRLELSRNGWKALSPGVKKAYSSGQRGYERVLNNPTPRDFHEWRKRAKELWYQVVLLKPLWPEQLDAMASELKALGEHLGDYHDLAMLRQRINGKCGDDGQWLEIETLKGLIEERHHEL